MFRGCTTIVECLRLYRTHELRAAVLEIPPFSFAEHFGLSGIWLLYSLNVAFRLFYCISNLAADFALHGKATELLFVSNNSL